MTEAGQQTDMLRKFVFEKILYYGAGDKILCLLGKVDNDAAILKIVKKNVPCEMISKGFRCSFSEEDMKLVLDNSIYKKYTGILSGPSYMNEFDIVLTCPAAEHEIERASNQNIRMVEECAELYEKRLKSWMVEDQKRRCTWIFNIFNGVSEQDAIVYRSDKYRYLIHIDLKCDMTNVTNLYLLVLFNYLELYSIRDLKREHIDMLEDCKSMVFNTLKLRYGINKEDVYLFFHYPPSFSLLHLHVKNISTGASTYNGVNRCYDLDDVIENIKRDDNFYSTKTFRYSTPISHPRYLKLIREDE